MQVRKSQESLNITIRKISVFKVQPDAVEAKVGCLLDKEGHVMSKATHPDRLVVTNPGERLTFSHSVNGPEDF